MLMLILMRTRMRMRDADAKSYMLVIPAKAGLRRQYAGANICAANGPKGARQESRV